MMVLSEVEKTRGARVRKLFLTFSAIGGAYFVQMKAGQPVTWPVMALVGVLGLGFVSTDTLDKALQSGSLGKLKDKFLPGDK